MSATNLKFNPTEILSINVIGNNRPSTVAEITQVIANYNGYIFDIEQAVIHENLNLGLLIALPENEDRQSLENELTEKLNDANNRISIQTISKENYAEWVGHERKPRHIVTLLARQVTAEHMASVSQIALKHGLSFDKITRLSGRVELGQMGLTDKSSVEFSASGHCQDLRQLRADFMELSAQYDIDIAVQEDDLYRRMRRLVCFDMDSTLIEAEVIDELAIEAGVGDQVAAITEAAMRGEIDFNESFSQRMALLEGLPESTLETVANRLRLSEGAENLFAHLHKLGYKTAILSGGFDYFARFLQKKLGVDYIYANTLDIAEGKVTGKVVGTVVNGERKAQLLKEIADRENISLQQVIAVGDGANDLPMLSTAGLGIAFRAKPLVKASAEQSISQLGLDAILYLLGMSDREMALL